MGGGGQQVGGVAVGAPGTADPFAVHREDRSWWPCRFPLVVVLVGVGVIVPRRGGLGGWYTYPPNGTPRGTPKDRLCHRFCETMPPTARKSFPNGT